MTWICAVAHHQREFRAFESLTENGFWAWMPTRTVRRKPRHLKREIERTYPLFGGGYIFVQDPHRDLYGVDGVRAIVCNVIDGERRPRRIDDDQVANLQRRAEAAIPMVDDVLRIGEAVYVTDGPFYTYTGKIERPDAGKGVLSVLLDIFGRQTPVEMSLEQLARAA